MAQPPKGKANPNPATQKAPISLVMDRLSMEMELAIELQKTLRSTLSPVLNQQPREEEEKASTPIINGSSNLFSDLDAVTVRLAALNAGYLSIKNDIEL